MYVANPTKQHYVFNFREPRNNQPIAAPIPSGGQVELGVGQHWSIEEIGQVVQQLERFGARPVGQLHRDMRRFQGLLYSDRVIQADLIETAHVSVVETQEERAAVQATNSALGFDTAARRPSDRKHPSARVTEVTVVQQGDPREPKPRDPIEMTIQVDPEGRRDVKLPSAA